MKLLLHYIRRHIGTFLAAILFLCLEAAADLMQPTLMSHIVDDGVKGADTALILRYGGMMLAVAAAGALGAVMRNRFASQTSQRIGKELRSDIYRHVQSLSFENIDRLQPASIVTRITNDVTQMQDFVNSCMRIMFKAPVTCIGAIVLIIVQTPRQIPVMAVILILAAVFITANMKLGYPRFGRLQGKLDQLNDVSREFLSSIRVVKAFGAEQREQEKFGDASGELAGAGVSAMRVMAVFGPLINLAVNMGIIVLLWLSQSQNASEIGRLMASVNYMTQVSFALGMVSNILNAAVRAMASSKRVSELLDEQPAQAHPEHPLRPDIRGAVAFEDVSFVYAGGARPSISHICFQALPGETIGVIGPTGSGKSTLVNLVPRFYDATEGRVLVDGQDVRLIDTETLRSAVAIVPQKALLFTGTIGENLRWGKKDASDDEIARAAEIACADGFIQNTADAYDTLLGQGGVNLSGGQKQRLALARALLRNPRVLILDDCTSALDASTEAKVLSGLRERARGMTVLLISQRVSTVMRADKVLCLEDGQVRGFGTHAELLASCAAYQAIYASQIGGERNE